MNRGFLQKYGPLAGILALCLALGATVAAGIDVWVGSGEDDTAGAGVFTLAAIALTLAIGVAMRLYARATPSLPAVAAQDTARAPARKEPESMQALLSTLDVGIAFMSAEERVVYCNPTFLRIWKIPREAQVIGVGIDELFAVSDATLARPGEHARFLMRTTQGDSAEVKFDMPVTDGRLLTQQSHAVNDSQGQPLGRMWVFEDVTSERRNAKELSQLAERDALTGLYNRHRFNEEITRMCADAQRNGARLALLFFDLDGFKYINDTFGHRAGDATLIRVAKVVGGQVRRNEIFARLGGDEFAILVPDALDEVLKLLVERITRSISQTRIEFEGETMHVTCSCGIAVYPDNATTPDTLLARADAAMYQAKVAGKNGWCFSRTPSDAAQAITVSPLSPQARVKYALENNWLVPHYQGIYAARERTLRHYEVLLRVRDPETPDTLSLPGDFIMMAEKAGCIVEVDRWMLAQAIQQLARDPQIPALAVNISGRSLENDTLPGFIDSELKRHSVAAERLLVEVTETAVVSDLHDARRFIEALQLTGCGVSLDDFGTGFSSFTYLKHLNVDSIKIDGLFIRALPEDRENQLFVQAIISVARGLHKTTIAECVEDEATLKILTAMGVDYAQGFHLQVPHTQLEQRIH